MLLVGAALCIALVAMLSGSAHAGVALEERKLPMKFSWVACQPNCRGWVSAVGMVTADSPRDFDEFARGRQLGGATDARSATYSADDLMIVERDIGRLAKYTFDMGGTGDLLSLSLNVPPWEDLHELSREELRLTNLVTTDMVAQPGGPNAAVVELSPKPVQGRFASSAVATETTPEPTKSAKSAGIRDNNAEFGAHKRIVRN
jgi:hypothetical protein